MLNNRSLLTAVLFAVVCSLAASAQKVDSSSGGGSIRSKFTSLDGGFTIDLPSKTDDRVETVGNISSGGAGTFMWRNEKGNFAIGFVDGISSLPGEGFSALNGLADTVTAAQDNLGSRVIDRCPFSFGGYPGVELRIQRSGGKRAINRFILVGHRLYILTADWPDREDENLRRGVLDSFELIDAKALVA